MCSSDLITQQTLDPAVIESLVLNGDLKGLTPSAKVAYYNYRCQQAGLDPSCKPFDLLTLNGNYTLGRCYGLENQSSPVFAVGYTNPADPNFDRGYCNANRTHIANATVGTETPHVGGALGAIVSNWRVSGILTARSGAPINVTTGQDNAFNGQSNQRVNQVSSDTYGAKTLNAYLNRAALDRKSTRLNSSH